MPGLLAQLPDPAQMQAVRDGVSQQSQTLASITTTLGTMPIGDIRALAEALSGLSLPDLTPLGDALPSNLGDLTGRLPADPAALLGQLPQLFSRLAAGAEGDLLGALGPALEQFTVFQELSGRLAAIQEAVTRLGPLVQAVSDPGSLASKSPAELVQFASDLLQLAQPFGVLGGDSQTWLLGLVETLRLWSTGTPEQLSGFVTGRIAALEADVQAAAGGIPAAVAALGALTAVVSGVDPATLLGPALADLESLPALDFASAAGLQTARTTLGRVQTTLGGATATLGEQIDQAISRLQQSGAGALEDELQRLVLTLRAVADLETTDNPLAQTARQVSGWIAGLDSPDVQAAVQGVLAELRDVARRFDLSALQAPLVQAAGQILQGVEEVERLQAEVAAGRSVSARGTTTPTLSGSSGAPTPSRTRDRRWSSAASASSVAVAGMPHPWAWPPVPGPARTASNMPGTSRAVNATPGSRPPASTGTARSQDRPRSCPRESENLPAGRPSSSSRPPGGLVR